jgi:hypothetical protein
MCRRDRLPGGIPAKFLHKKKTDTSARTRAARYLNPVVAVKHVEATASTKKYKCVHVSFQSTSSCNILTVNALNECQIFVRSRCRGRGKNQQHWGIEMNEGRVLYLHTYLRIDSIDHLIKNASLFYCSWKYWHSPMLHAFSLAIVTAYDMYLKVAEGKLNPAWQVEKPMDYWHFGEKLSEQMLGYNPASRYYPGDQNMRSATMQTQTQREQQESQTRRRG